MSIEKLDLNQKSEDQLTQELQEKQNELAQKSPDFIVTSSKPFDVNPQEGELFEWGRENVKNIQQDIESLTEQQDEIERSKKIIELRNLIRSYEEAIKAIERGEKYQVVLNKNNFDMRYDSVDKLHDQITKTEEELKMLESKKDIFEIKENTPIEIQEVEKTPIENIQSTSQDELAEVLIELKAARTQMEQLETKFKAEKDQKSKGFLGKVKKMFHLREENTSPEFLSAKQAWEQANNKYIKILQNRKK